MTWMVVKAWLVRLGSNPGYQGEVVMDGTLLQRNRSGLCAGNRCECMLHMMNARYERLDVR